MEKKLIIGLGNPGKKYQKTRHNVGFMVLDALAANLGVKFELKKKLEAEIAVIDLNSPHLASPTRGEEYSRVLFPSPGGRDKGRGELKIILAKPQTFMNESSRAIRKLYTTYKILNTDLLIVHDEIDLAFSKIKFGSGRSAGHKGIESIIESMGGGFQRLRIGIENRKQFRIPPTEDYVLQNFTAEELKKLREEIVPKAIDEIKKWLNLKIGTYPLSISPS